VDSLLHRWGLLFFLFFVSSCWCHCYCCYFVVLLLI
jgi:hypothetical protein